MQGRRSILTWAVAGVMVVAACGQSTSTTAAKPIRIGVEMSLTGPFAQIGQSELRGIQLRVNEINAAGGIGGRKIEITTLDDGSDPARAVTNVRRLLSDQVVAVFGPTTGVTAPQTATLTAQQGVLQFLGIGPEFFQAAPTTFTLPPPLRVWVDAATCYLAQVVKAKRAAGLFSPDAAGSGTQKQFPAALKAAGIDLVSNQQVALDATDTTAQWARIRDAQPDAVLDFVTGANGALTLKAAKDLKVDVPKVGYITWALPALLKLVGTTADGVVVAGHITAADPTPAQQGFVRAFLKAYPEQNVDAYSAYGYDMVQLFAAAIKSKPDATQKDGPALGKALEQTTVKGVVAQYRYKPSDPNDLGVHSGVKLGDVVFLVVKDGQFVRNPQQPKCA